MMSAAYPFFTHSVSRSFFSSTPQKNMSEKCGNCDCADKTQCVKKGYAADIIETEKSYTVVMDAPAAVEHDSKCKCGSNCTCTDCTCGH